ncbi:complement factor H-like isoform X1 [Peromyscus maniculatus bairdii]|uniref:complement factor H-like isoform X1 n=1 Tax=Peromyscus maniculatus bairdii TaxID=230844 RepID=UPI001C2E1DBF|nr:complement factor H-like isoform X3 [Peromyscus maniculatus bairdii]
MGADAETHIQILGEAQRILQKRGRKDVKPCDYPQIKNGGLVSAAIHKHSFPAQLGKRSIIYCNRGFGPFPMNVIYCTQQGWEPKVPCRTNSCMDPPHVENATITWLSGETVRYECNKPLKIFGEVEVICQNGTWTEPPRCKETTCKPPSIPNGFYFPQKTEYKTDDAIIYDCKVGSYPATKIPLVKCTSDGWIPAPRCNSEPCDFPQIKNGRLYDENYLRQLLPVPAGKWFFYHCNSGYKISSDKRSIICTGQGWEPQVPCVRECNFHNVENRKSLLWDLSYTEGQSAKVNCQPGYSPPNGQDIVTCTENGWSPQPKCIRVSSL